MMVQIGLIMRRKRYRWVSIQNADRGGYRLMLLLLLHRMVRVSKMQQRMVQMGTDHKEGNLCSSHGLVRSEHHHDRLLIMTDPIFIIYTLTIIMMHDRYPSIMVSISIPIMIYNLHLLITEPICIFTIMIGYLYPRDPQSPLSISSPP